MKKICIISKVPIFPTNAGNRSRIKSLIEEYKLQDLDVYFIYLESSELPDYEMMTEYFGDRFITIKSNRNFPLVAYPIKALNLLKSRFNDLIGAWKNYLVDGWYPFGHHELLVEAIKKINPDFLQVEYIFLSYIFKNFPNVVKIIDTHDTHANRHQKLRENVWFSTSANQEKMALLRSDIVIAITNEEKNYFEKITMRKNVFTVGHILREEIYISTKSHKTRIGFIGSINATNRVAALKLLEEFVLLNQEQYSLLIAGKIIQVLEHRPAQKNIMYQEFISQDDFYRHIDVLYNPTKHSTGLKIKNVEALYHNKKLITSKDGSQGLMDGANKFFISIDDSGNLKDALQSLSKKSFEGKSYIDNKMEEWRNNLRQIINSKSI